jgi:hypothetical protein
MRYLITSLLVVGCVASTAGAPQSPSGGTTAGQACALLTRDLAMKVSTPAGKNELERAKPSEGGYEGMTLVKGASACAYGPILLVLDGFARPAQIRTEMRDRGGPRDRSGTPIYKNHEPVSGVGDEAFFDFNSAFANLHVWTGSRHFSIQMSAGYGDEAKELKPNVIALAKTVIPLLK